MSFIDSIEALFPRKSINTAKVTGQKDALSVVAETDAGAVVILLGKMDTGKHCYYDRKTNEIIGEAPDIEYRDYPV